MATARVERRLAAILAADVVGYSGLMERDEDRTLARLKAHRLAPHRVRTFKLSRDPAFVAKLRDVVGLYMHPPAHAIVLSVDEKSQIQALDRTQPGLPMRRAGRRPRPTTTSATAQPRCSPPSTCWTGRC